jgi:hypothetical protein
MNIEKLARKAIDKIKSNFGNFPQEGYLAGGSLANLIWEYTSGQKAVINDVDIFNFHAKLDDDSLFYGSTLTKDGEKLFYNQSQKHFYQDYTGLCTSIRSKDCYLISHTENKDIYNHIFYKGTNDSLILVIDSFDLNCTQIGYDIKNDTFVWTEEFSQFLKTGELRFTNLNSPHHSAIRILKKRDELNAKLDEEEFKLCVYAIQKNLNGITRRYFTEKYANIFINYQEELGKYFNLVQDEQIPHLIKLKKNIDLKIFTLEISQLLEDKELFPTLQKVPGIWRIEDFFFYKRYIEKSTSRKNVWSKVNYLFSVLKENYLDEIPNNEDLDLLCRTTYNAANIIKNIDTLTITQQIILIKKLFAKFNNDISVALALLEKHTFTTTEIDLGDDFSLLLELTVRKEIVNNVYKIDEILGTKTTNKTGKNSRIDIDLDF